MRRYIFCVSILCQICFCVQSLTNFHEKSTTLMQSKPNRVPRRKERLYCKNRSEKFRKEYSQEILKKSLDFATFYDILLWNSTKERGVKQADSEVTPPASPRFAQPSPSPNTPSKVPSAVSGCRCPCSTSPL